MDLKNNLISLSAGGNANVNTETIMPYKINSSISNTNEYYKDNYENYNSDEKNIKQEINYINDNNNNYIDSDEIHDENEGKEKFEDTMKRTMNEFNINNNNYNYNNIDNEDIVIQNGYSKEDNNNTSSYSYKSIHNSHIKDPIIALTLDKVN